MKNKKDGYIVKYKNNLAETRYSLKIQEQRLLLELVSKIHKDDEDFKEYEISIKDFMEDLQHIKGYSIFLSGCLSYPLYESLSTVHSMSCMVSPGCELMK